MLIDNFGSRGTQLDQVFGSLDEPERTETLRRLMQEITNRYQESSGPLSIKPPVNGIGAVRTGTSLVV